MDIEDYRKLILALIEASKDLNYMIAVHSFAEAYPDNSRIMCPQKIASNS